MKTDPWDPIFAWLGIEGSAVVATFAMASIISNFLYRLIPDDSVGWKAVAKSIFKVVGLYTSNRITSGVTVNDIAKEIAKEPIGDINRAREVAERVDERIEEVVESAPVPAFPGLRNRGRDLEE